MGSGKDNNCSTCGQGWFACGCDLPKLPGLPGLPGVEAVGTHAHVMFTMRDAGADSQQYVVIPATAAQNRTATKLYNNLPSLGEARHQDTIREGTAYFVAPTLIENYIRLAPAPAAQPEEEKDMPETIIPSSITDNPTINLALEGGKRSSKMLLSVRAMGLVQGLARKVIAKHLLPPEHVALLDTPLGQAFVDTLSPLLLHLLASQGYLGVQGSEFIQATAAYAYEGQVFRHGLILTDTMAKVVAELTPELAEIRTIGAQFAEEAAVSEKPKARTPVEAA